MRGSVIHGRELRHPNRRVRRNHRAGRRPRARRRNHGAALPRRTGAAHGASASESAAAMKIAGAGIRRFLDAPDKAHPRGAALRPERKLRRTRPRKSWRRGRWASPTIPTPSPSSARTRSSATARGWPTRWPRNRCWAGRPSCGRASTARAADAAILDALEGIERGEPGGFLIVEAGDLGSNGASW